MKKYIFTFQNKNIINIYLMKTLETSYLSKMSDIS